MASANPRARTNGKGAASTNLRMERGPTDNTELTLRQPPTHSAPAHTRTKKCVTGVRDLRQPRPRFWTPASEILGTRVRDFGHQRPRFGTPASEMADPHVRPHFTRGRRCGHPRPRLWTPACEFCDARVRDFLHPRPRVLTPASDILDTRVRRHCFHKNSR